MADWAKLGTRGNVEDRRGLAPALGTVSVAGVALLMLFNYLTGGNPLDALNQIQTLPTENRQVTEEYAGEDKYEVFASTVLGSNNQLWENKVQSYDPPKLVLFRDATLSSCGHATSAVGPHYCPLDSTIYLDETFFDELKNRFGAKGGDVAEAYVISHEVGHHVQNETGTMGEVQNSATQENAIKLELQADCYAGMWAATVASQGILMPGEIDEAMDAAASVGDDRIQERATGSVNPESWTHGSSEERVSWFNKGFNEGSLDSCDTFD